MDWFRWRLARRIRPYGCTNEELAAACRRRTWARLRRATLRQSPDWDRVARQTWKLYLYEAHC